MSAYRGEIKDRIRVAARASDSECYDATLDSLINSKLRLLTNVNQYDVLQVTATLTPVDATSAIALPTDYQHPFSLHYNDVALTKVKHLPHYTNAGPPYLFRIGRPNAYVFPYADVVSTDTVDLVYYKVHTLDADSDQLLIPEAEDYIVHAVAAHVVGLADTKQAQRLAGQAQLDFIALRTENVRN